jgi:hypothetical protein
MGQAKIKKKLLLAAEGFINRGAPVEDSEFEAPVPSPEASEAAAKALAEIHDRSFAGRNPEVGKMIKCQVCSRRHRDSLKCEQKFSELWVEEDLETGELTTVYRVAAQEKGTEVPGQRLEISTPDGPTRNQIIGTAPFKGKRKKPRFNKRTREFIQLVHSMIPGEYTEEQLQSARKKATRQLAKKYGRFNILPRKSAPQPKKEEETTSV